MACASLPVHTNSERGTSVRNRLGRVVVVVAVVLVLVLAVNTSLDLARVVAT